MDKVYKEEMVSVHTIIRALQCQSNASDTSRHINAIPNFMQISQVVVELKNSTTSSQQCLAYTVYYSTLCELGFCERKSDLPCTAVKWCRAQASKSQQWAVTGAVQWHHCHEARLAITHRTKTWRLQIPVTVLPPAKYSTAPTGQRFSPAQPCAPTQHLQILQLHTYVTTLVSAPRTCRWASPSMS